MSGATTVGWVSLESKSATSMVLPDFKTERFSQVFLSSRIFPGQLYPTRKGRAVLDILASGKLFSCENFLR